MSPHDGGLAALNFPHSAAPGPSELTEVAPGVHWLRMPLPFALDHINLWLLDEGDGWTIVDTGLATEETRALWSRLLNERLEGRRVKRLLVTHFHPDHIGLAGWLAERLQVPLWCTETEWLFARMLSLDTTDGFVGNALEFYRRTGLDEAARGIFAGRGNSYRGRVSPIPYFFHRLVDGQLVRSGPNEWRVVVGRGHSPEHACLYSSRLDVLIAGDQVLPKISPNVSLWPQEPEADALGDYLASLAHLKTVIPASALVLPSHGLPFFGGHRRIDQLAAHHQARLSEVETACATARTASEIVPVLFRRSLDAHQLGFAVGEALAHLQHLVRLGRLRRSERADGVYLYGRR